MLCPEIFQFEAPKVHFHTKRGSPNQVPYFNTINDFVYNHLVTVIIPEKRHLSEVNDCLNTDSDFYKVNNLPLSEFSEKNFTQNFVNNGSLYSLSINTRIDCDNCFGITPKGRLHLNLDKETYQTVGLEGQLSHFHYLTKEKYVVTVDLTKPLHERTKSALAKLKFNVIISWEPHDATTCPSSIAKYFGDRGYDIRLCEVKSKTHLLKELSVPVIETEIDDFIDWLGMVSVGGDLEGGAPDNYVTTYEPPEGGKKGDVLVMQSRGIFPVEKLAKLVEGLRKAREDRNCDWIAIYVQGFSDSPIAWSDEEHHFYVNGDNSYILVFTKDEVIVHVQKCSRKRYNNKRKGKQL